MTNEVVLARYTIEIIAPDDPPITWNHRVTTPRVVANLPAMLETIEEDLTDLLPPGYRVAIKEEK